MSKGSKYTDISATMHLIGNVYNDPSILEIEDKYFFSEEDFSSEFHKIVFGSIYNLYQLGAKKVTLEAIEDYLDSRPKKLATYKENKGPEYILNCSELAKKETLNYYYHRVKKMSLLRGYERFGMDLSWLYDPDNIFDGKKKQEQEDRIDRLSLSQIADLIDEKISTIRSTYVENTDTGSVSMAEGARDLLNKLKENPEVGYPLYGKYINTILRGARLKKFYLRSAATGVGKSRSMVADAVYIGCDSMYNLETKVWESTGPAQPTMYIATEQDLEEVQTMVIAFLSGVNEETILNNEYSGDEWERVSIATDVLEKGCLSFVSLPDFSLKDIENTIKSGVREKGIKYIFHDYLHTSMKILEEITKRSGGVKLREDNILFMISIRMKDICTQYGVFIMTATQLNGDYITAKEYDQNLLRGAKSIADKIDAGMIMLEVSAEDLESLKPILDNGYEAPTIKISVYKNRRGRWKGILMWCKADRGCCRIDPIFVTKYNYELCEDIRDTTINVKGSAF